MNSILFPFRIRLFSHSRQLLWRCFTTDDGLKSASSKLKRKQIVLKETDLEEQFVRGFAILFGYLISLM